MRRKKMKSTSDEIAININENYDVEHWANRFGIRPQVLREITAKIGTSVRNVKAYLKIK